MDAQYIFKYVGGYCWGRWVGRWMDERLIVSRSIAWLVGQLNAWLVDGHLVGWLIEWLFD